MSWAAVQKEASEFRSDRDERLTQKQTTNGYQI